VNPAHTHSACWYHGATGVEPLCGRSRRKLKLTTDPKLVDCPECRCQIVRALGVKVVCSS
jgi:hypothetical protein